jgi:transposase-like protein
MTTKRKKRVYTPEFRSEAVRLFRAGDRPLRDVARPWGARLGAARLGQQGRTDATTAPSSQPAKTRATTARCGREPRASPPCTGRG